MKPHFPVNWSKSQGGGFMNNTQSLSHSKWECKYHVVWIPKCRRKMLYGQLRKNLGEVFHELARQKESQVLEGHLQPDHVHILLSIPPKYSVAQVVGYMKGKSAIHIARTYLGQKKNYLGMSFWARGYFVSTVGYRWRGCTCIYKRSGKRRSSYWTTVAL